MYKRGLTLDEFTIFKQKDFPNASGDLSKLLRDIGLAAKLIHRDVNKAGLVDILGSAGTSNVQGEEVQKLDIFANSQLHNFLETGGQCCGFASEEEDHFVSIESEVSQKAKYVVLVDPLDGSSNIDVNASIGTIFSIYRRRSPETGSCQLEDFLQPGRNQVAAGYVIYGSSTMMVYTTGYGVHGFTLDPSIGEFCLSHPNIQVPQAGSIYSLNQGNYHEFKEGVKAYIDYCSEINKEEGRPYTLRYIGSMVADFHRNLIKGGIFLYPTTQKSPNGKLRLLYECNPMSLLIEQAGGKATDGERRILDIEPTELHQRTPIMIGSKQMVEKATEIIMSQPVNT